MRKLWLKTQCCLPQKQRYNITACTVVREAAEEQPLKQKTHHMGLFFPTIYKKVTPPKEPNVKNLKAQKKQIVPYSKISLKQDTKRR
jgi:hypothetical protein